MINRSQYYLQAPVGNRSYIRGRSRRSSGVVGLNGIEGWHTTWLASGTMSLAVAVLLAVKRRPVKAPKVLVPAYGCPDLVSAVRYAGAEPLFVDLQPNQSRMDLELAKTIARSRQDLVAIIGVDLFGISEDWSGLKRLAVEFSLFLIQDLAQSVQSRNTMLHDFQGDAVVFSFGRGKPVCCLVGGALLTRAETDPESQSLIAELSERSGVLSPRFIQTKAAFYDFLLRPCAYAQLARVMGDRLGQTVYKRLRGLAFLSAPVAGLLNLAVERYWEEFNDVYDAMVAAIEARLGDNKTSPVRILRDSRNSSDSNRMSRLAVLISDAQLRMEILTVVRQAGLSATTMYTHTLPEIVAEYDGVKNYDSFPNALAFSRALVTLPTHGRLSQRDIDRASSVLGSAVTGR
jgi:dTDP-4-amino-4,6-dideoxygalactose transaminase